MSQGDTILESPAASEAWSWAVDNPHYLQIKGLVKQIKTDVQSNEFFHKFLSGDAKSLKSKTDETEWTKKMHQFVDTFDEPLKSLAALNKCVLAAHELFSGVKQVPLVA